MEDSAKDLQATRGPSSCEFDQPSSALEDQYQVTCAEYAALRRTQLSSSSSKEASSSSMMVLLLDVRVKEQYDLCSLEEAINIPLETLSKNLDQVEQLSEGWTKPIYCLCRRGIASVEATKLLNDHVRKSVVLAKQQPPKRSNNSTVTVPIAKNIRGGLDAWRKQVDKTFPQY